MYSLFLLFSLLFVLAPDYSNVAVYAQVYEVYGKFTMDATFLVLQKKPCPRGAAQSTIALCDAPSTIKNVRGGGGGRREGGQSGRKLRIQNCVSANPGRECQFAIVMAFEFPIMEMNFALSEFEFKVFTLEIDFQSRIFTFGNRFSLLMVTLGHRT